MATRLALTQEVATHSTLLGQDPQAQHGSHHHHRPRADNMPQHAPPVSSLDGSPAAARMLELLQQLEKGQRDAALERFHLRQAVQQAQRDAAEAQRETRHAIHRVQALLEAGHRGSTAGGGQARPRGGSVPNKPLLSHLESAFSAPTDERASVMLTPADVNPRVSVFNSTTVAPNPEGEEHDTNALREEISVVAHEISTRTDHEGEPAGDGAAAHSPLLAAMTAGTSGESSPRAEPARKDMLPPTAEKGESMLEHSSGPSEGSTKPPRPMLGGKLAGSCSRGLANVSGRLRGLGSDKSGDRSPGRSGDESGDKAENVPGRPRGLSTDQRGEAAEKSRGKGEKKACFEEARASKEKRARVLSGSGGSGRLTCLRKPTLNSLPTLFKCKSQDNLSSRGEVLPKSYRSSTASGGQSSTRRGSDLPSGRSVRRGSEVPRSCRRSDRRGSNASSAAGNSLNMVESTESFMRAQKGASTFTRISMSMRGSGSRDKMLKALDYDEELDALLDELQEERDKSKKPEPGAEPPARYRRLNQLRDRVCGAAEKLVISDDARLRRLWDLLMLFLVCYIAIMVPVRIAFSHFLSDDSWETSETVIDVIFLIDVVLHFFTTYMHEGREVRDPKRIAMHYLKGWFAIDFVSALPVQLMGSDSTRDVTILIKILKFLKLIRVVRMGMTSLTLLSSSSTKLPLLFRACKLLASLLIMWHLLSCAYWFAFVTIRQDDAVWYAVDGSCYLRPTVIVPSGSLIGPGARELAAQLRLGWNARDDLAQVDWSMLKAGDVAAFCEAYFLEGAITAEEAAIGCAPTEPLPADHPFATPLEGAPAECTDLHPIAQRVAGMLALAEAQVTLSDIYSWCFYWAVAVSSGFMLPEQPEGQAEQLFTILVTVLGLFVTSFVVGNVTSFIGQTDRVAALYQERMDNVKDLMQQRKVTKGLRRRILRYFEYTWKESGQTDEIKLMTELPFSLRLQLTLILHKKLFTDVPLFQNSDTRIVCLMVQQMRPMISLPHEVIIEEGAQAKGLFIITKGRCEVTTLKAPDAEDSLPKEAAKKGGLLPWRKNDASPSGRTTSAESTQSAKNRGKSSGRLPVMRFQVMCVLSEGDFFGEVSLLTGEPSSATVRSQAEHCSLMVLLPAVFNDFLRRFPMLREEMERCKQEQQRRYSAVRKMEQEKREKMEAEKHHLVDLTHHAAHVAQHRCSCLKHAVCAFAETTTTPRRRAEGEQSRFEHGHEGEQPHGWAAARASLADRRGSTDSNAGVRRRMSAPLASFSVRRKMSGEMGGEMSPPKKKSFVGGLLSPLKGRRASELVDTSGRAGSAGANLGRRSSTPSSLKPVGAEGRRPPSVLVEDSAERAARRDAAEGGSLSDSERAAPPRRGTMSTRSEDEEGDAHRKVHDPETEPLGFLPGAEASQRLESREASTRETSTEGSKLPHMPSKISEEELSAVAMQAAVRGRQARKSSKNLLALRREATSDKATCYPPSIV